MNATAADLSYLGPLLNVVAMLVVAAIVLVLVLIVTIIMRMVRR